MFLMLTTFSSAISIPSSIVGEQNRMWSSPFLNNSSLFLFPRWELGLCVHGNDIFILKCCVL